MNVKKVIFAIAVVITSCALFTGNAFAAWAACTPAAIGPQGASVKVQLINCNVDPTNGAADAGWMTLGSTGTDQMMAAILTAMSLNKTVAVEFGILPDSGGLNTASAVIFSNN